MPRTRPPSTRLEFRAAAVRLLRELLSKVTKHAQATLVDIRFRVGIEVSLAVIDNGVGPGEPLAKGGHGLQNLHQRAKSLGGDFTTQPAQRRGPVATWSVPRQMPARIQS
jgi:signal transduction histidine kinase